MTRRHTTKYLLGLSAIPEGYYLADGPFIFSVGAPVVVRWIKITWWVRGGPAPEPPVVARVCVGLAFPEPEET